MGFDVLCESCGKRLSIPAPLFERKVHGRVVTIACKSCGAPIRIDATLPPPPMEESAALDSPVETHAEAPELQISEPEPIAAAEEGAAEPAYPRAATQSLESWLPPSVPRPASRPASFRPSSAPPAFEEVKSSSEVDGGWPESLADVEERLPESPADVEERLPESRADDERLPESRADDERLPESRADDVERSPESLADDESWPESLEGDDGGWVESSAEVDAGWEEPAFAPPIQPTSRGSFSHQDGPISVRAPMATIGRYALFEKFATGGMATVHLGRLDGAGGFSRVVAIKRLLPHLLQNAEFAEMLLNEARLAARVRHPNVVPTLDVVASKGDVLIVLEYVHGEALSALRRRQAKIGGLIPFEIATRVMLDVLQGLHAVHGATDEKGRSLGLVHRDVSPQNVIVGVDGIARVLDFGIVKALERMEETRPNKLKGKTGYMSPEQIRGERVTRRSDVFSAGIVLWELLTLRRFSGAATDRERMDWILGGQYPLPSEFRPELGKPIEEAVMRALAFQAEDRYPSAREFADAIARASDSASVGTVADWVKGLAAEALGERERLVAQVENWDARNPDIELSSRPFTAELAALEMEEISQARLQPNQPPSSQPPSNQPPSNQPPSNQPPSSQPTRRELSLPIPTLGASLQAPESAFGRPFLIVLIGMAVAILYFSLR